MPEKQSVITEAPDYLSGAFIYIFNAHFTEVLGYYTGGKVYDRFSIMGVFR
jgi:hypothetical protein